MKKIIVWDLPLRIFHMLLASLVVAAVVTAKIGGNALEWHMRIGIALLGLLLFRLLWGFFGGSHARFANFIRGPRTIADYVQGRGERPVGHNPLGALAVVAMLAVLFVQIATGLFSNDDVMVEGPFSVWISKDLSDSITWFHQKGQYVVYALVGLHVAAVFYYRLFKKEDLLRPMLTGRKLVAEEKAAALANRGGSVWHAIAYLSVSLLAVWGAVALAK